MAGLGKMERIVDYFQRASNISTIVGHGGICPCTHPLLVRILNKRVVKHEGFCMGRPVNEYTVILQQRRTGQQCETTLLEAYFEIAWAPWQNTHVL